MEASAEIERQLSVLAGLPFWRSSRACDLQGFQFGAKHSRTTRSGETVEVGEYALHVECAWRVRAQGRILVASQDRYEIVDGSETWDRAGANLLDVRMASLIALHCPARVTRVRGSEVGDVCIEFAEGLTLDVWVDDSGADEHWRFFRPDDDFKHWFFEGGRLQHE
jgi:hypothetical protein